jgi:hypothetical protein
MYLLCSSMRIASFSFHSHTVKLNNSSGTALVILVTTVVRVHTAVTTVVIIFARITPRYELVLQIS